MNGYICQSGPIMYSDATAAKHAAKTTTARSFIIFLGFRRGVGDSLGVCQSSVLFQYDCGIIYTETAAALVPHIKPSRVKKSTIRRLLPSAPVSLKSKR